MDRTGPSTLESELILWLAVRWIIGFVGPLVLGWMAWETARIRSTQSATGILYVVVILCFSGRTDESGCYWTRSASLFERLS